MKSILAWVGGILIVVAVGSAIIYAVGMAGLCSAFDPHAPLWGCILGHRSQVAPF